MKIIKFGRTFYNKYWENEILNNVIALDTETTLITSPAIVPNLVLTTAYDGTNTVYIIKNQDIPQFMLMNNKAAFYMYNAAFDVPVLEKQGANFDSVIAQNRLLDGQILYRLLNIATLGQEAQKWSLDSIVELFLNEILEKNEEIRLTFGQYLKDGIVNYSQISEEHIKYACLDPIATFLCMKKILDKIKELPTTTNLAHNINLVGDIALAQVTRNGLHIDQDRVLRIKHELEEQRINNEEILATYGYIKGKKGNTKILEEICKTEGFALPTTETGKLCIAKNYLKEYESHPFISAYLQYKGFSKQENFLTDLSSTIVYPRYNTIKVTSRTSCSRPNIQQFPRIGGIRECVIPSPGNVFLIVDYSAIELCAIAAICLKRFKYSVMAELINQGKDLHKYAASQMYNVTEEQVTKEQRQTAKILNFGLIANMSPQTFVGHAAKFGLVLELEESTRLKNEWSKVFPEIAKYWKSGYGKTVVLTDTGFIRGNCTYTEWLNCSMQSRCIEGAKLALYNLVKNDLRVVGFIHDEIIVDCPKDIAEETLTNMKDIMIKSMELVIKGVKISVSGEICERFKK